MADPARPIDAIRAMLADLLGGPDASIARRRESSAVFAANMPPLPDDLIAVEVTLGGLPAEQFEARGVTGAGVILHLHGGGYVMGDPAGSRGLTTALARGTGARVLSVDYRLAPAHPFPAAVDDALAAYRALLAGGTPPGRIAIGGESAGGGLTVALLLAIRDAGMPQPACAFPLSPWVDLTCEAPSYASRAARDPLLTRDVLRDMAREYLAGGDARTPLASPLLADLSGLAPMLIQVGDDEVLLDDAVRLADAVRNAGGDADLEVWPDMIHVWQMFAGALPEADQAVDAICRFITARLRAA